MSLEKLKDVNFARILSRMDMNPAFLIFSLKNGYIASKLGDQLSRDYNLFHSTIFRETERFGLSLSRSVLGHEIFRMCISKLYNDLYSSHLNHLYNILDNIFSDSRELVRLAVSVCNMLLLFVSPDEKVLEKVLGESLYYWARIGAKFGYIVNQNYEGFVNNYNEFMALIKAVESETEINFDISSFTSKEYRKLFADTLVDVYNSYLLISDEFELLMPINNGVLMKEIAKVEIQKETSASKREILDRSLEILYGIYELIRRNVSDLDEYDVKIKMLEDVAGNYDFCKVILDTFKAIKVHEINTISKEELNKLYKAWLQAIQLLIHELHKQR